MYSRSAPALVSALGFIVISTSCNARKPAQDAATAVTHSEMTNEQHLAMHGTAADSSFAAMQARGKMAMGVDQYASAHRFDITPDGGRIELQRKTFDSLDVAQIRAHMKLIQHAFEAGDFSTPAFVHMRDMPGTAVMTRKKDLIRYVYADLPRGAEVRIITADDEARAAIAQFLEAQRAEHRATGEDSK